MQHTSYKEEKEIEYVWVVQQLNFSYKNASLLKNDIYEISVLGRRVVL